MRDDHDGRRTGSRDKDIDMRTESNDEGGTCESWL
jgi:hypothetical protein